MTKFSRAALLKKKKWTGEDVGQAYIYNLAIQAPGRAAEPIDGALVRERAAALDFDQFAIYRQYMNLYNWLISEFSMAQATIFHAKSAILELATVLLECESADERRTRLMKATPVVDGPAVTLAIQRKIDELADRENPLMFDGEELADVALLNSCGRIAPREYCKTLQAIMNPSPKAYETRKELENRAEQQRRELMNLDSELAELLAAHKGENTLDSFDGAALWASIADKLNGKSQRVTAPLTLAGLGWYQEYKAAVNALPDVSKARFSFVVLYYLDFEGFYTITRDTFNPLHSIPRCIYPDTPPGSLSPETLIYSIAPAGTPTIKERPDDEGSVTVKINPDGTATDLLADGEIIANLTEKGIYSFTGKGKDGNRLRDWYGVMMRGIKADIEATYKFNTLIDIVAERAGVADVKRYKRDFEQLKFGASRYNLTLVQYQARLEFTGETKTMKYTFDDLEKRTAALDVVNKLMEPITLEPVKEYPAATIERIRTAFEDLNIFGGGVSKIYALFNERG